MAFKFVFMPPGNDCTREWGERLAKEIPEASVSFPESEEDARRELPDANAAFGTIPAELLREASELRWLQAPAAAPPVGYYYPELVRHPVTITNFRGIYNDHIATHILAFMLAFARGLHLYIPRQVRHEWKPERLDTGVVHLPETTALIVGVGGIGGEAARLCSAFGVRVIGLDARQTEAPEGVSELHPPEDLDNLLPQADWVILTVPHTPETEGMMNAERFGAMKPSAYLINIGRGMTVRLDDLVVALRDGEIAGAGLDVYEIEPLPSDHPLWSAPNVLLTPHTAGFGPYLDERRFELILDNSRRFIAGEPLRNVVDKSRWY